MNKFYVLLVPLHFFFVIFPLATYSQNHTPVVTNVGISQRTDCSYIVDIHYDVSDVDGDSLIINVQVSDNNGASWDYLFSPANATGDIGPGIVSGTKKHIEWDFSTDHPNEHDPNIKVKIIAEDSVNNSPCHGVASFSYGGQTYNTVEIGTQCWMKENLNIGTFTNSTYNLTYHSDVSNNGIIEKYCYNNIEANCNWLGGLYDWNEMMQYDSTPGSQGICAPGWHIPTKAEWDLLQTFLGYDSVGGKMKEPGTTHWLSPNIGASNESGFTALGAGRRISTGAFAHINYFGDFYSSSVVGTTVGTTQPKIIRLYHNDVYLTNSQVAKAYGLSVRCIKDIL